MKGHIYLVQVGQDGPIKIGWTRRGVNTRLREWCGEVPWAELRFLGKVPGDRSRERRIQRLFKQHMILPKTPNGVREVKETEWFHPAEGILRYTRGLQAQHSVNA